MPASVPIRATTYGLGMFECEAYNEAVEKPFPGFSAVRMASSSYSFLVLYRVIVTLCGNSSISLQLLNVVYQTKQLPL